MNIEIRHTEGINSEISVRNAWKLMDSLNVVTLPITEGRKLTGLVSIDDIAANRILKHLITEYCRMLRQVLLILLKHLGKSNHR